MTRPIDPSRIEVVDDKVAEILRRKTTGERGEMVAGMWRTARLVVEGGVRMQHPDWTADQVAAEVVRRMSRGGPE